MVAAASASAPGPSPTNRVPAQIKTKSVEAAVEIVKPMIFRPASLGRERNGTMRIGDYRVLTRGRQIAEQESPYKVGRWYLIFDFE